MKFLTINEAEEYLNALPARTRKHSLEYTRELLKMLGNPQDKLRVIHVAGTNGKGSVCAYLNSIFLENGLHTGLFTSPHLIRLNERFRYDGKEITDEEFLALFGEIMDTVSAFTQAGNPHPTYFELLFLTGVLWFARNNPDFCIVETGMGGRFDVTNAIPSPVLCVITSISTDHTQYLGSTIGEIAYHKAGIIKTGVPVVYDGRDKRTEAVILEEAEKKHAQACPVYEQMVRVCGRTEQSIDFTLNNKYYDSVCVHIGSPALYQTVNCALAMTAAKMAVETVRQEDGILRDEDILRGAAKVRWPGRMDPVLDGVIVDGAHNADGIDGFLETAGYLKKDRELSLLFSAAADKDCREMIRKIGESGLFSRVTLTRYHHDRSAGEKLTGMFRDAVSVPVTYIDSLPDAFAYALRMRAEGGLLMCCGSLYLAGEIMGELK